MRKALLATVSAMTLSLGAAWADDEALVLENDGVPEVTIDVSEADVVIENPFGYGLYDAEEILDANLVGNEGRDIADPIDLLIDSDENVAYLVTYVSGQIVAIPTETLTAYRRSEMLVLRTDHTREELVAMGHFDMSDYDYRLYSEDVYHMVGMSEADAETSLD